MSTAPHCPIDDNVATVCECEDVARSVVTVLGRPVVRATLVCELCGREWVVERLSETPLDHTLDTPESS